MAVSRPQAVWRHIGVADDLSGAFGDEIGKAPADNTEAPLPHVILARRLGLEGREPMEDVMRVEFGDCRNVTRLAARMLTLAAAGWLVLSALVAVRDCSPLHG